MGIKYDEERKRYVVRLTRVFNGKRIERTASAKTLLAAKAQIPKLEKALDRITMSGGGAVSTVSHFLARWLEYKRGGVSRKTLDQYEQIITAYLAPKIGHIKMEKLNGETVAMAWASLRQDGRTPHVIRYCHAVLSAAMRQALRWGVIERNPCDAVDRPKVKRKTPRVLTPDEAAAVIQASRGTRYGVLLHFAIETGCRPGEYLALQWPDIDFETRTVTISRSVVQNRKGGGWQFEPPKTELSRAAIPISGALAERLREQATAVDEARRVQGEAWTDHDLVFPGRYGQPMEPDNVMRWGLRPVAEKLGIDLTGLTLYKLRHTAATLIIATGGDLTAVKSQLRHSTITLAGNTYVQPTSEMLRNRNDAVSEKLTGKK